MPRKRFSAEQIVTLLRQIEVTMPGKRWRRYESLSISERYTARPYQASACCCDGAKCQQATCLAAGGKV
jgi:hypothetical protein